MDMAYGIYGDESVGVPDLTTQIPGLPDKKPRKDAMLRARQNILYRLPGLQSDIVMNYLNNYASELFAPIQDDGVINTYERMRGEQGIAGDYEQGLRDVERVFGMAGQTGTPAHASAVGNLARGRVREEREFAMDSAMANAARSLQVRQLNQAMAQSMLFGQPVGVDITSHLYDVEQARRARNSGGGIGGALAELVGNFAGNFLADKLIPVG